MVVLVKNKYIEMTPEEIAAIQAQVAEQMAKEAKRQLTMEEVIRLTIAKTINSITIEDETALRMVEFYPEWEAGQAYTTGYKVQYGGKLWRCIQAHTSQDSWAPSTDTASLWERIDETHTGDQYDPIPYEGNMALENGKYYAQDGVTYLCNRDTGIAVYNALSELVGIYVEKV